MSGLRDASSLIDDRGRVTDPAAIRQQPGMSGMAAADDPQLADLRMRALLDQTTSRSPVSIIGTALVGAVIVIVTFAGVRLMPGLPGWVPAIMVLAVVGIGLWARASRETGRRAAAAADLFLREGRCAGCAYVLHGVTPAPDDCIVCPECGAAWNRSRIDTAPAAAAALHDYRRRVFQPTMRERWLPGARGLLMTTDARGVTAHISNPQLRDLAASLRTRLGEDRVLALRRVIGWRQRGKGVLISLAMLPGLFTFGSMMVRTKPAGSALATLAALGVFAFSALMIVLLLGFISSMLAGDSGLSARRVAREFVSRDVCPQCLDTLDGIAPDDQGLKTCRSCGAAWRATLAQSLHRG